MTQTPTDADSSSKNVNKRNFFAFWVFGLCTNFVFVIMLTAAQDILNSKHDTKDVPEFGGNITQPVNVTCTKQIGERQCSPQSAGLVLLANILPSFVIRMLAPFVIHQLPYCIRHHAVVIAQTSALLVVVFSQHTGLALAGVSLSSFASGLGEMTYLSLASHYSKNTIVMWASGTGTSGIIASTVYAALTDRNLVGLTPKESMLGMLIIPVIFTLTHHFILIQPDSVPRLDSCIPQLKKNVIADPEMVKRMSIVRKSEDAKIIIEDDSNKFSRIAVMKSLLVYIVPLFIVYFSQYFINQGLAELTVFDCAHGFGTSVAGQYRWYQVMYQAGVFASRTSGGLFKVSFGFLVALPVVQVGIAVMFFISALSPFIPHMAVACGLIFSEGVVAGTMYVGSMQHVHKTVAANVKEFALLNVTIGNALGVVLAAFISIPVHNAICSMPYMKWF